MMCYARHCLRAWCFAMLPLIRKELSAMNKFHPFCFVLLLGITAIQAKTYAGRVIDGETEAGLAGVSVSLLHSPEKATTDQNGQFSLSAEVSVRPPSGRCGEYNVVQWLSAANAFTLSGAPQVQSIGLFNLKGERLFFREKTPGNDKISLPGLPRNVYIMRIAARGGALYGAVWAHLGADASFPLGGKAAHPLSKHVNVVGTLVFEKQAYQTKQKDIESDSTYTAMLLKLKPDIGSCIFDEDSVRTYKLRFTDENKAKLLDFSKLITNKYTVNSVIVPGRLEIAGRALDSVAVRFRGDQSLWDCVSNGARKKNVKYPQFGFGNGDICAKFSMKFDFNKYKKDQRLFGLKALNFRSMSADPTKMHEKLGFSIFKDMGIVSPRTAYAKLYVNDTLWGLFGVTEQIDGRFTKAHYPNTGNGNLYSEIWPDAQLTDAAILNGLTTNNDSADKPDISDFKALRDMVTASGTTASNLVDKCRALVDIPYLVRYVVVDRGIMNFDGIMSVYGSIRHNYCWYHDEESNLFKIIPWDLDKALLYPEPNFWTNNMPNGNNKIPNWNVVNSTYPNFACSFDPGSGGGTYAVPPIDKDKFLRLLRTATWNDFCSQGRVFLDSFFVEKRLNERIGKWRTLITQAVGEDPTINSAEWSVMVDSLSHTIPLWRKNLEMMIDTLIVQ